MNQRLAALGLSKSLKAVTRVGSGNGPPAGSRYIGPRLHGGGVVAPPRHSSSTPDPTNRTTTTTTTTTTTIEMTDQPAATRDEKILQLRKLIGENGAGGWDAAWQEGVTPWDRGNSQPPLKEFIESDEGKALVGKRNEGARVLVPGCGKGYDAAYFASLGYDALGADLSTTAIEKAKEFWADSPDLKSGKLTFEALDFFEFEIKDKYDLVYDYTFFCALPLELRASWGSRMRELVRPGGHLITLVYPMDGGRTGGPPYSVDVEKVSDALQEGGGDAWTKVVDVVPRTSLPDHVGRERLVVWERTPAKL
ncbi:hypothetical protein FRB90_011513 [Tulasnella sp. 427]|nr:hypothetical protein FRB90_011513 [Tulasnella sp. 427]